MHEYKSKLEDLKSYIYKAYESQKIDSKKEELKGLSEQMANPGFWGVPEEAQKITKHASELEKTISKWERVKEYVDELVGLFPDIKPETDPDGAEDFKKMFDELQVMWDKLEIETFLGGKYDRMGAILTIHAGTGGTDAQDFGEMLKRMYLRFIEMSDQHGDEEWKATIIDESRGEEAGIKSVTISVEGPFAYGYMKGESGVHRLVRLSPFNAGSTRETSFVLVEILPDVSEMEAELEERLKIDEKDLRIDTYRSSGPGGQNVNKTDSAVRITHIPTGIAVACQNERSQLQNKEQAMKILRAKLMDLMEKEQAEEIGQLRAGKQEMTFGSQIRSYVLHPYKMVKDHRTDYEESNPDKVLNGELEGFIEAELKKTK